MKLVQMIMLMCCLLVTTVCSRDNDDPSLFDDIVKVPSVNQEDQVYSDDLTKERVSATTVTVYSISGKGILWKPVSDSTGKLAVLLKRSYGNPPIAVYIRNGSSYRFAEQGKFVY